MIDKFPTLEMLFIDHGHLISINNRAARYVVASNAEEEKKGNIKYFEAAPNAIGKSNKKDLLICRM